MKQSHTNHIGDTVRLRRLPRVKTDELGHNIWLEDVETGEFEIMSKEFIESMLEFGHRPVQSDLQLVGRSQLAETDNDPRNTARRIGWPCRSW